VAAAPRITHRSPQALTNMIPSTREAKEEFERGLSSLWRYALSPFPIHNSENCRLSSAGSETSSTFICPILSAAANRTAPATSSS
jgi:hypothetical protein